MRVIDLFAGCGGLSMGFEKADFEVVAAYDNWKESCEVYAANFNHPIFQKDLSALQNTELFREWQPDMIIGGPPCQDFSSAGKRDETLGRADLTLTYARIISDVRPEWFVMENVERIQKSSILQEAIDVFKASGYGISYTVLLASHCGVPQSRKRFFMVGHLHSTDGFLDHYFSKNLSDKPMTVADYMGKKLNLTYYYRHPRSYARRGIYSVQEPSATIRGVNRPLPKTYQRHAGDPCDPDENVRPLTTLERSYLQTFPEGFKWLSSKTNQEQMIGNAVPVKLAEYVANCIAEYIADTKKGVAKKRRSEQQLELFAF
ncbi:MAG: DNA cytosine methyltransferase [Rudanella sp.]|nr:DNA cytosine methyltransferase [Rudanella sp.]